MADMAFKRSAVRSRLSPPKTSKSLDFEVFLVVFTSFDTKNLTIFNKAETAKYVETLQQESDKNQNRSKIGHFSSIISIASI